MEPNSEQEKKKQDIHSTDISQSANSTQELNDDEMKAVLHNLANADPSQSQAIDISNVNSLQKQPGIALEDNAINRSTSADGTEPLPSAELADRLGTKRTHSASNILSYFKKQTSQQQQQHQSDSTQPLSEEEQKNALAHAQVIYYVGVLHFFSCFLLKFNKKSIEVSLTIII